MSMTDAVLARLDGPLVLVGFGSVGRATLPLLRRHIAFDPAALTVIDPQAAVPAGIRHLRTALTRENYREVLSALLPAPGGLIVNLSVDTGSADLMALAQGLGALYVDTVVEPWPGVYYGGATANAQRTNYALREEVRALKRRFRGGVTGVSCAGANPGMVSWLLKEALLKLAGDLGLPPRMPDSRAAWARLMRDTGTRGVHIAERDTQTAAAPRPQGTFVNTWSVEGFLAEGWQPAELGWGTHEKRLPRLARRHRRGCRAAIWLDRPGAETRVRTWVPGTGAQLGFLVTHNEAISIADYFTLREGGRVAYRPTCHYAYHPCDAAVLSLHETAGRGRLPERMHILTAEEIVAGSDDLGVLLYGHAKGALWYGSRLSIDEARALAPDQNATGLQVSSAVLAAAVWAIGNPRAGIVETEEMDHVACLQVQRPYLGRIEAHYTGWTPGADRIARFAEAGDAGDPWQFGNFLAD
jgi:homospermidine synthase